MRLCHSCDGDFLHRIQRRQKMLADSPGETSLEDFPQFLLCTLNLLGNAGSLSFPEFSTLRLCRCFERDLTPLGDGFQVLHGAGRSKDPCHGVIVLGRNRIKLVIMTASTAYGHSQEGPGGDIQLLIHHIDGQLCLILFGQHLWAQNQETGSEPLISPRLLIHRLGKQVPCDLLDQELIEGFVLVEGPDHVISIAPRLSEGEIFIETVGIGIAHQVQP